MYGITDTALKQFKNYLSTRYQVTKIYNYISSKLSTELGVLQSSYLGPMLFLICTLFNYVNFDFTNIFADNTLVAMYDNDVDQKIKKLNKSIFM